MIDTQNTQAIVLKRSSFREVDSKAVLYALDFGKIELVARGAKKPRSKLAAHIEPLNLIELMIIKGKNYDYVGTALSINAFPEIKNDFQKIQAASAAFLAVDKIIKYESPDDNIFYLIKKYLEFLNDYIGEDDDLMLQNIFLFKLLALSGYKLELYYCVKCRQKIKPKNNTINYSLGGIVCGSCQKDNIDLTISENDIKILRLIADKDFQEIMKIKFSRSQKDMANKHISSFYKYLFD